MNLGGAEGGVEVNGIKTVSCIYDFLRINNKNITY